jgi:uncharacterized protein YbjT (DUF2867 family)
MKNILITGATGNVGLETIKSLMKYRSHQMIYAGVQHPGKDSHVFKDMDVMPVHFDFEHPKTFLPALINIDVLFILRPPQISDARKCFEPLLNTAVKANVKHVVFLSVQGADKNKSIPHHKIEKIIMLSGLPYTFLRPSYFMQNFTTTLKKDIDLKNEVFLPAGKAKFSIIDLVDLGEIAARILLEPGKYLNRAMDLTNNELLSFGEMTSIISEASGRRITYTSPNLLQFWLRKRKDGVAPMFIFVMIMLHFLPRFKPAPALSTAAGEILEREPVNFRIFAARAWRRK